MEGIKRSSREEEEDPPPEGGGAAVDSLRTLTPIRLRSGAKRFSCTWRKASRRN